MQIAVTGLGRMGANVVRRPQHGGHACIAYDVNAATVERLVAERMTTARSLRGIVDFPSFGDAVDSSRDRVALNPGAGKPTPGGAK